MKTLKGVVAMLFLSFWAGVALAQTSTTVDISPVTNTILTSVFGILGTVIIPWLSWYVKAWIQTKIDLTKTQIDEQLQQTFNEAMKRSMAKAAEKFGSLVPKNIDLKNAYVAEAARYFLARWPDLAVKVKMGEEAVKNAVLARLPSIETEKADAIVLAKASGPGVVTPVKK